MNISIVDDAENEENRRLLETVGLVPFVLFTVYDYIMLFLGEIWRNYNFTGTKQTIVLVFEVGGFRAQISYQIELLPQEISPNMTMM